MVTDTKLIQNNKYYLSILFFQAKQLQISLGYCTHSHL